MEYRFLITYTIKEDNTKALNAITSFLTKYGFEKDEDQSTYLSKGKKCSLKEIQDAFPGIKGFNRRGLYRMKQFYELYKDNPIVSSLVTQLSWTNHLLIMSGCK